MVATLSVSTVLGAVAAPSFATGAERTPPQSIRAGSLEQVPLTGPDGERSGYLPAALDPDRLVTVMLEVEGAPVAAAQGQALDAGGELSEASRGQLRAALEQRQEPIRTAVEGLDGTVLSAMQDAFNGLKVRVPQSQLRDVSTVPGVVSVRTVPTYNRTNETSVPFLGVPDEVWEDAGATGEGISIGIIDTGIDYTHADFGGPGTVEAFEANDPTVVELGSFPTRKVVGGVDFVGDDYDASAAQNSPAVVPVPDDDPVDCNGHGTHVAGTAAGAGVVADGSTYTGTYDSSTYATDFAVGPGVAPEASLYALKVFGCAGSTDIVTEAIDWAVANDLDVINLSLGSDFSAPDDPSVDAINNAARAGTISVLSAGNAGEVPYIVGSPGNAERGLSVAAVDSTESFPGALLSAGGEQLLLQVSNGVPVAVPVTGELVVLQDDPATPANESLGCDPADYSGIPAGAVVVTLRGECDRVARAILGQAAGAGAVVLVNLDPGLPPVEGPIEGVTIPFLGATPEQGAELEALDGEVATVTEGGPVANPGFRAPASFTSAGPGLVGDAAKPDVSAPGVSIVSAAVGSGAGGATFSGTSMAAPHVAGVAALVRERRPTASVENIKAAIVNTADPGSTVDYSTLRLGAGLVDPAEAISTPAVAIGDRGTASLSFGFEESSRTVTETRRVQLKNTRSHPVSFSVDVEESSDPAGGAAVSVSPRSVTVPAGRARFVRVTVTVTPAADFPAEGLQAASGTVVFTPTAGRDAVTLRVPYVLVHRAISALDTRPDVARVPADGTVEFTTRNASDVPGAADVYAWGFQDPAGDDVVRGGQAPDIRAVGVQAFPDVDPFPTEPTAQGVGVFAINSHERLGTASAAEYDVLLDVDENGSPDFAVVGLDVGLVTVGAFTGEFASVTFDLSTNTPIRALLAGGAVNSSTVTLPFVLSDVGVGAANPDFLYDAATFTLAAESGSDEVDGRAAFDVVDQPVETGQFVEVPARASVDWTAAVDVEQLVQTPVAGWMVVYAQNRTGSRQAELIRLAGTTG